MTSWDTYEITNRETPIHGVMLRGRIRKFALVQEIDLLTENASDVDNVVRFALHHGSNVAAVGEFVTNLIEDAEIKKIMVDVKNPVLSKLKVNLEERYEI